MNKKDNISKKSFYLLISIGAILILFASLEALIKVKDIELFNQFKESVIAEGLSKEEMINAYLSNIMAVYFIKISIPFLISLTALLTLKPISFGSIIRYLWLVLAIGGFSYTAVEISLSNIFYYSTLLLYLIYIWSVITAKKSIT